jgi:hypothetical protein
MPALSNRSQPDCAENYLTQPSLPNPTAPRIDSQRRAYHRLASLTLSRRYEPSRAAPAMSRHVTPNPTTR